MWEQVKAAYALNRDFLSDAHAGYRAQVLKLYACPADSRCMRPGQPNQAFLVGLTSYLGVEGTDYLTNDGILYLDSRTRMADVRDGLSNALMVGERPPSPDEVVGWWYGGWGQAQTGSQDMVLGTTEINGGDAAAWRPAKDCWRGPYFFSVGSLNNPCDVYHFWSLHPGGANFAFADGSVRFLTYDAAPIMPALATRAGAEAVAIPD